MKLLFDLSFIRFNIYAGVSKYAYRILDYIVKENLCDNFILLLNSISENKIREWYPNFDFIVISSGCFHKIPIVRTMILSYKFRKVVNKSDCNIVFCPWGNEISCLPINKKKISVIHDLQLRIDLKGINLLIHKLIDDTVIRYSDRIVTISEFSKRQILSFYPELQNDKVICLGNSVSEHKYEGIRLIKNDYILYVGRICKMKNLITLIKAFSLIHNDLPNYNLVIIGKKNDYWEKVIVPIIESNAIDSSITVVEECSEKELSLWYKYAKLFVFPSLREGFGSPPIEAAISECPVLSTTCDSLIEVLKNKVYTYSNPCDAKELGERIREILYNEPSIKQLKEIKSYYLSLYSIDVFGSRICNYLFNCSD